MMNYSGPDKKNSGSSFDNQDFGIYGRGYEGYAHYMQAVKESGSSISDDFPFDDDLLDYSSFETSLNFCAARPEPETGFTIKYGLSIHPPWVQHIYFILIQNRRYVQPQCCKISVYF